MERYELEVETREGTGKGVSRRLRRNGKIPGIVYGKSIDSTPLIVDPTELYDKLNKNAIIDLKITDEDEEEVVMIKDYQRDVIKDNIIHVDFQQIFMDEEISVTVPINIVGDAIGVQEGGVLQELMREVEIEALPEDIPRELDLDISELEVGDSLQVSDIEAPEDIKITSSFDNVIVTVVPPSEEIEEEVEEELEEEFIEPEVIGEEGEEEEEIEFEEEEEEEEERTEDYY
uniref:Ribosomal protein L25 n=1 Tax=uncultured organism TaxID=155900 RepID=M1PQQ3_9ZZZZ|nr:ribosomal protein L25 [uncultured organism]